MVKFGIRKRNARPARISGDRVLMNTNAKPSVEVIKRSTKSRNRNLLSSIHEKRQSLLGSL